MKCVNVRARMERLNLSLDPSLFAELTRLAKAEGTAVAGVARRLLQEAVAQRRRLDLQQRMSAAYAAGAKDPEETETLREMQGGQDDLIGKDE